MGRVHEHLLPMGHVYSKLEEWWMSFQNETEILILGLDNAGKTAVLYALQLGEPLECTVPTIGFNVETVAVGNITIKMWDIGGQTKLRALWPHYFEKANGVVFVVDSNDVGRVSVARAELHALLSSKELVGKPFLILANKQDLPLAMSKEKMVKELRLDVVRSSPWHIIECCAVRNQKVRCGFDWLANHM
jgi:small GTP-binding protein|tara:strand:- start:223 stop:792 length:570 start_codon:yes stop_codon:yes gene_type:complete